MSTSRAFGTTGKPTIPVDSFVLNKRTAILFMVGLNCSQGGEITHYKYKLTYDDDALMSDQKVTTSETLKSISRSSRTHYDEVEQSFVIEFSKNVIFVQVIATSIQAARSASE